MSFLPLRGGPGDAVEVGVRILRLDERPEPPDGGGVCDVRPSKPPSKSQSGGGQPYDQVRQR